MDWSNLKLPSACGHGQLSTKGVKSHPANCWMNLSCIDYIWWWSCYVSDRRIISFLYIVRECIIVKLPNCDLIQIADHILSKCSLQTNPETNTAAKVRAHRLSSLNQLRTGIRCVLAYRARKTGATGPNDSQQIHSSEQPNRTNKLALRQNIKRNADYSGPLNSCLHSASLHTLTLTHTYTSVLCNYAVLERFWPSRRSVPYLYRTGWC